MTLPHSPLSSPSPPTSPRKPLSPTYRNSEYTFYDYQTHCWICYHFQYVPTNVTSSVDDAWDVYSDSPFFRFYYSNRSVTRTEMHARFHRIWDEVRDQWAQFGDVVFKEHDDFLEDQPPDGVELSLDEWFNIPSSSQTLLMGQPIPDPLDYSTDGETDGEAGDTSPATPLSDDSGDLDFMLDDTSSLSSY